MPDIDQPDLENPDDPKDTAKLKAILTLVAAVAFVVSPLFTDPFTGFDPGLFPVPVDDPPVQPAGYAFALWGLIYLGLVAMAGYGLFRRDTAPDWDRTRWPLFISLAVGASWISVANIAPVMATILIFVMLGGALLALSRAPKRDQWWFAIPVGLYAGWLSAASFVALGTVAMGYGLVSPALGSWIALALALALAAAVTARGSVLSYPAAVAWALVGIVVANLAGNTIFALAAALGALALAWLAWKTRLPLPA